MFDRSDPDGHREAFVAEVAGPHLVFGAAAVRPASEDAKHLSKVSETDRRKIVRETAAKLYGLN